MGSSSDMADVIVWLQKELVGAEEVESFLDEFLVYHSEEALIAAYSCGICPEDIEESYCGEWVSDAEFVQDLLEQCGEIPADLPPYIHIDWERTASEIMMDYSEDGGHYFRVC